MSISPPMMSPNLFRDNPFRILGLPSNARHKQIRRRATECRDLLAIDEQGAIAEQAIGGFSTDADEPRIREASGRLADPATRLLDEIFWFRIDETQHEHLQHLSSDEPRLVQQTLTTWHGEELYGGEEEALLATHNLAVFYHTVAVELERRIETGNRDKKQKQEALKLLRKEADQCWQQALTRWRFLAGKGEMWNWVLDRLEAIGKERLSLSEVARLETEFPQYVVAVSGQLILRAIDQSRSHDAERLRKNLQAAKYDKAIISKTFTALASDKITQLTRRIDNFKTQSGADSKTAGPLARELAKEIEPDLKTLDAFLGREERLVQDLHEQFAESINIAQVAYAEETDDFNLAFSLVKIAEAHATSESLGKTIARNIDMIGCHFCPRSGRGKRKARSKHHNYKVGMYRVSGVEGTGIKYQTVKILVPCCTTCRGTESKARTHASVKESLDEGWKFGDEPTDSDAEEYMLRALRLR